MNQIIKTIESPIIKASRLMELEKQKKEIAQEIDILKADLLKTTQELDVLSLKTGSYTISRVKRLTPKIINIPLLKKELDKRNIPYIMEETFAEQMKPVFKQLAEQVVESKETIKGFETMETEYIMIRVSDK